MDIEVGEAPSSCFAADEIVDVAAVANSIGVASAAAAVVSSTVDVTAADNNTVAFAVPSRPPARSVAVR